jgi:hypothetical protein
MVMHMEVWEGGLGGAPGLQPYVPGPRPTAEGAADVHQPHPVDTVALAFITVLHMHTQLGMSYSSDVAHQLLHDVRALHLQVLPEPDSV